MVDKPKRIRLVSEEPVVANLLRQRKPLILPEPLYYWAVDWVHDIMSLIRDREWAVATATSFLISFTADIVARIVARRFPGLASYHKRLRKAS